MIADRELHCPACGTRAFSSRAPELLAAGIGCPRCGSSDLELRPEPHEGEYAYPRVLPVTRRPIGG